VRRERHRSGTAAGYNPDADGVAAGQPVARYVFLGEQFPTRADAEAARYEVVVEKAREFYRELDKIYLSRRGWREAAPERAGLTDGTRKRTQAPPPRQ